MSFTPEKAIIWVKEHKWLVAIVFVLMAGYTLGKDMALRDNAAERQVAGEQE